MADHGTWIAGEVLAVELTWVDGVDGLDRTRDAEGGLPWTIAVDGAVVAVALERAAD